MGKKHVFVILLFSIFLINIMSNVSGEWNRDKNTYTVDEESMMA